jgi:hypothetical protein
MVAATPLQGWPYPLPSEVFTRQAIQDLAEAMHFSLSAVNPSRLAVLERTRGLLGNAGTQNFTNGSTGYMAFTIDHLDNWGGGGRAITSTQGPTLPTGLYLFAFSATITALSAAYNRLDVGFERGGTQLSRRTFIQAQSALRITAPVRVPAGSPQQVKVRMNLSGATGGSTITIARNNTESSPRLTWVQIANG